MSRSVDATETPPTHFNGLLSALAAPRLVTLTTHMDAILVDQVGDPSGQIFASEAEVAMVLDRR